MFMAKLTAVNSSSLCSLLLLLLPLSLIRVSDSTPILSCDQLPHPQICSSIILQSNSQFRQDKSSTGFRNLVLHATLQSAMHVHEQAAMKVSSFSDRSKLAWQDCLELCRDTILKLNRSLESMEDAQIWLSAAMANQETCENGFAELNSSFQFPSNVPSFTNLSESISNSLAVNKAISPAIFSGGNRRGLLAGDGIFPSWVSAADRKLLQSSGATVKADLVVAKDGSGNYKTISEAVAAAAKSAGSSRFVIYVKSGVYDENVDAPTKNLMIIGDGIDATVVTGRRNVQDGSTTFRSATFAVTGDGFIAQDITFENTAGPEKHQAVALRSGSDHSVFYRCSFKGYQDTLYVYSQRQFYRECDIYGTIDFIFGDAVAVIQSSNLYVRRPMSSQKNTVTAQGRADPNEDTGIVVHASQVTAGSDLRPVQGSFKSYLGRPWKEYSRTVFMKCALDGLIDPAGWLEWSGDFALSTLYYAEYMNTGEGAVNTDRVKWRGYRVITSDTEAAKFTVANFISGNSWIPGTGVPFTSGL